jgi:hypothetical protein
MSTPAVRRQFPWLTIALAMIVMATTVVLAIRGWDFYRLSKAARAEFPDGRTLTPFGKLGNGYGWISALLVVLNLSYLVRRRLAALNKFGSMQMWLDIHVFTGLMIASLVSFHSAFQLATLPATLSAISLAVVVITGMIGRFLHTLVPLDTRERLAASIEAIERDLPDMRDDLAATIAKRPGPAVPPNASFARAVAAIPAWRKAARDRVIALEMLMPHRQALTAEMRFAWKDLFKVAAADARMAGMTALLRSWRGLHRFFALLMIASVALHIFNAGKWGYWWPR